MAKKTLFFSCFLLVIAVLIISPVWATVKKEGVVSMAITSTPQPEADRSSGRNRPLDSAPTPTPLPTRRVLENNYHIFQSFNNCGPASLSMTLSYYGINESQEALGLALRPYQIPNGDNDDKSVTLAELAEKAKEYELTSYHRPNGNMQLIKQFIAHDMPILTRTWLKPDEDIGHYRVIKGYTESHIIQDDSLQGKNLSYSYNDFNQLWKKFNYEYVVLVPKEKIAIAKQILGEDIDEKIAWQKATRLAQGQLQENPNDISARFNLSVAYYNNDEYQKAIDEFEKVENQLSFRTLWYQIEPIKAYYAEGNNQKVFAITERMLNNHNRAFSELYLLRGDIYKQQGNKEAAKVEYENAVYYNQNLKKAKDALALLQ